MKKIVTSAEETSGIPTHSNAWETTFTNELSDQQKQALRIMPDAAGGDKLISAVAAKKFKSDIDKAKQQALSNVNSAQPPAPLLKIIETLKSFKTQFEHGKTQQGKNIDVQRSEAEKAKASEMAKKLTKKPYSSDPPMGEYEDSEPSNDSAYIESENDEGF